MEIKLNVVLDATPGFIAAISNLTLAFTSATTSSETFTASAETAEGKAKRVPKKKEGTGTAEAETPAPENTATATTVVPPKTSGSKVYTLDQINAATVAKRQENDAENRVKIKSLLNEFMAGKTSDLTADQYGEYMEKLAAI